MMTLDIPLRVRIMLAIISAVGVSLTWQIDSEFDNVYLVNAIFYGLPGLFFAAGVLFPYIKQDKFIHLRATGLVIASAFSYWTAVQMTADGPFSAGQGMLGIPSIALTSYIAGSMTGALIVLVSLSAISPQKISWRYLISGLLAGIIGGAIANSTLGESDFLIKTIGFASWHTLICLAIYYGRGTAPPRYQAIP